MGPWPTTLMQSMPNRLSRYREVHAGRGVAIDANLNFPEAAAIFYCTLGVPITLEGTPRLYTLLQSTLTDASLATHKPKTSINAPDRSW